MQDLKNRLRLEGLLAIKSNYSCPVKKIATRQYYSIAI